MTEKYNKSIFSKVSKNMEHKVAKQRVQLESEELMMTSMMERVQETQKARGKLKSALTSWRLFFKMKCRRRRQRLIPGKYEVKGFAKEVADQSTKKIAGRRRCGLLNCCSTTVRSGLFATLWAVRESSLTMTDIATSRRQPMGGYSVDVQCSIEHR